MRQHWRSVLMIVVGGAFVPIGVAMTLTPGEPFIGLVSSLFGFAVLITGVATFRADDAPWRMFVLLGGGVVLGVVCLIVFVLMLSPDSSLWEYRRATALFWSSIAGIVLFLVGGVTALVLALRRLRSSE